MAPVIDFQGRLFHRPTSSHPLLQFLVKNAPSQVQVLLPPSHRKHKMPEYFFGYSLSPRHLFLGLKRQAYIFQEKLSSRKRDVNQRRIRIKKHQCFPLFHGHRGIKYGKQVPRSFSKDFLFLLKILFYHLPISSIGYKMLFLARV